MGETPHNVGKVFVLILWAMEIKQKMKLTFGDLITAAPQVWGAGRAKQMVRSAISAPLVVFREQPHFLTSSEKGRSV